MHVAVRAGVATSLLLVFLRTRGEQDHAHVAGRIVGPDAPCERVTVELGHAHVEHRDVGMAFPGERPRGLAIGRFHDLVPCALQASNDESSQIGFVVGDEDRSGPGIHPAACTHARGSVVGTVRHMEDADEIPTIVLAPMAGGPSTVALAAAVCEAGGLGFLASGYLGAAKMAAQVEEMRAVTARPFGVNVFLVRETEVDEGALAAYLASIQPDAQVLGVEVGAARFDDDDFDAKLDVLLASPVAVVSFTFGCPEASQMRALHDVGTRVWVTVTSVAEARIAVDAGADAVIAQGASAGGHRASFFDDGGDGALDTDELVTALTKEVDVPVIAAGGIADATDVSRLRELGARAVQVGTAFLLADEAGTNAVHRAAVASRGETGWTRAFSGRTARGIVNDFMREHPDAPIAYPQVHHATAPLRAAARAAGDPGRTNLWAGTRHEFARAMPARAIVQLLLRSSLAAE
ncbi:MAG: Nitronate monooxygenase [Thermoleophilia bacterium]|nr:Nitronate monooxygenase [Thermoleophilia bacterium]